jgi:nuclear protein localization family protein 4
VSFITSHLVRYLLRPKPLSRDPGCNDNLDSSATLSSLNLGHGSMVHCRVDPSTTMEARPAEDQNMEEKSWQGASADSVNASSHSTTAVRRVIMEDGSIKLVHTDSTVGAKGQDRGFRKGMLPLRDIKMHWTLAEFSEMDSRYDFKIKRQEQAWTKGVSLDTGSCGVFQNYLRTFQFKRQRFGYLYGTYEFNDEDEVVRIDGDIPDKKDRVPTRVKVECIYEPPQEIDSDSPDGFPMALEDPDEDKVEELASMLGLKRVGWIFGHPPREEGFQMSSSEILMAAELQLEAAQGVAPTPFVTVKVSVGDDGNASFEAFQLSQQCMEMVAESALEVGPQPGFCYVNETFTLIQEGKASKKAENNFFLTLVPIVQHTSKIFTCEFPPANRDHGVPQTKNEMKGQLSKSGKQGWAFIELLSDFALLLFLCSYLDLKNDMPKICLSVSNREVPLDEGYKIIISSIAGMDGSY